MNDKLNQTFAEAQQVRLDSLINLYNDRPGDAAQAATTRIIISLLALIAETVIRIAHHHGVK